MPTAGQRKDSSEIFVYQLTGSLVESQVAEAFRKTVHIFTHFLTSLHEQ